MTGGEPKNIVVEIVSAVKELVQNGDIAASGRLAHAAEADGIVHVRSRGSGVGNAGPGLCGRGLVAHLER